MSRSLLDTLHDGKTLIFGHRGASADAPMNTLAAFNLAVEQGADGIELDVHRSKDGHAVIVHDFDVGATTNGQGRVVDMTLAELKALDAGSWFGESFVGAQIPTLDEVFTAVGDKLFINVEIKSNSPDTDGVEQLVADKIAAFNMANRVLVSSFNPLALKRFRDVMPDVPIGFLYSAGFAEDIWQVMDDVSHEARHPHHVMIDSDYMVWAGENNFFVNTWTVNDVQRAIALRDLGVNVVMTDTPGVMRAAFTR